MGRMPVKNRKRKPSNFSLSDEPIEQPPSLIHNTMLQNQAGNLQQNSSELMNGSDEIRNRQIHNEQRGMADKTQKYKQSKVSLSHEPMRQPPTKSTRTHVGRRVYSRVVDSQQVSNQIIHHHHNHSQANFALNENIGSIHNHMGANQACNSQHEETQQITRDLIDGTNEVDNGQSSNEQKEKNTRGPTYMLEIWGRPSTLPRIQLDFDNFGRPIGVNKSKFSEFLGTIARNSKYCPLDVEDWRKMPKDYKKEMLNIVKSRFDITLANEDWILRSINKKWKYWKHCVKTRDFVLNKEVEVLLEERDDRVSEDQWVKMITYWNKDEVKAQSEKNKDARSKKNMDHRTRKKSFAQVYVELTKKKGRPPYRSEMFEECCTPANGAPSIKVSAYLDAIKEKRNQLPEGSEEPIGPNDIFAQATGEDRPGYIRMFGGGVCPSDVWEEVPNRYQCKRIMLQQQAELTKIKNEMFVLRSQASTQPRFASEESQDLTSLPNSLSRTALPKQTLRVGGFVALRSLFDPNRIVAKGCLHSTDPNTEVGKQLLGENWCQINIKVVLQPDEQLIRPYDYYQTLGDTLGEMVAWPCNLVTPSEVSNSCIGSFRIT